jgi:hypothetical protein
MTTAIVQAFDTRVFDGKPIEWRQQTRIIELGGFLVLDIDAHALEAFGRKVHQLNRLEATMMVEYLDRAAVEKVEAQRDRHHHNCFECGVWLGCTRKGCTETIGQCWNCKRAF